MQNKTENELIIYYHIKDQTTNKNQYIEIHPDDQTALMDLLLAIICYMDELSISKDKDIKEIQKWFNSSGHKYPKSKRLGAKNTRKSMLAGLINNIKFGNQYNISIEQLDFYSGIINNSIELITTLEAAKHIKLQYKFIMKPVIFAVNIFEWRNNHAINN